MNDQRDKPYSLFQKLQAYVHYLWFSKNRHGVHSPFVFDFIEHVIRSNYKDRKVELLRKKLLKDHSLINIKDFGTGEDKKVSISQIASRSLKKPIEAQLIARLTQYFAIDEVIEFGTSLGVTTAYIARSRSAVKVKTIEGSEEVFDIAKANWNKMAIKNIKAYNGEFDSILPILIPFEKERTLFFIDGNHRFKSTLEYFNKIKDGCNEKSIFIFDDIHWSKGMEDAWKAIKNDQRVTLTIDLFELGIVFINPRLKKEHFIIRK